MPNDNNDNDNNEKDLPTAVAVAAVVQAADAAADDEGYTSAALNARELEWAVNSPELVAEHRRINGGVVRTRCE